MVSTQVGIKEPKTRIKINLLIDLSRGLYIWFSCMWPLTLNPSAGRRHILAQVCSVPLTHCTKMQKSHHDWFGQSRLERRVLHMRLADLSRHCGITTRAKNWGLVGMYECEIPSSRKVCGPFLIGCRRSRAAARSGERPVIQAIPPRTFLDVCKC